MQMEQAMQFGLQGHRARGIRLGDDDRTRLVRSPFLVVREYRGSVIAHHALYGYPTTLNKSSLGFLDIFRRPMSVAEVHAQYDIAGLEKWVRYFSRRKFLIPEHHDERAELRGTVAGAVADIAEGRHLVSLGLVLDEACNFDCSYCLSKKLIAASGRSAGSSRRMSWPMAKQAVDCFAAYARCRRKKKLEVYFGGSEPLLNWEVMRQVILYCREQYGERFVYTFSTNTNASLITRERADFFRQHEVTVTTSLDGPATVNDSVRCLRSGRGTFGRILAGWNNLSEVDRAITWFCLTLTDENVDGIGEDFFDFIADRGITSCSFEPDIISPMRCPPEVVVDALLRFRRMGEARGITVGGMWDKPFKNMYEPNVRKRMFNCSAFTGRGVSILPSGDILPCSYSATKLGAIDDIEGALRSDRFRTFIASRAVGNIEACRGCEIEGQCMGGCYITSEYAQCTGSTAAFRYRCELYRGASRALLNSVVEGGSRDDGNTKGGDEHEEEAHYQGSPGQVRSSSEADPRTGQHEPPVPRRRLLLGNGR